MSVPRLKVVQRAPMARKRPSLARSVVGQVRQAMLRQNRLATIIGCLLGGFVPAATWQLTHHEPHDWRLLIVAGGLLYSAITVYKWGLLAFGMRSKAIGFVAMLEGVMVMSSTVWLSLGALAILIGINAIATAVALSALDNRE